MDQAKRAIKNVYPLSPMQMVMLYHATKVDHPSEDVYFRQFELTVDGELVIDIFKTSIALLVERYDILKTVFIYKKVKQPLQVVFKEKQIPLVFEDISGLTANEKDGYIEAFKKQDKKKGFELSKEALLRIAVFKWGNAKYKLIISNHHICMDGWCMGIVLADLLEIYDQALQNLPRNLGKVAPYSQYIGWLEKQDKLTAENHWAQYLKDYQQLATVPSGKAAVNEEYLIKETSFGIDRATTGKLELLAQGNGVTLSTIIQILWGFILQKYNKTNDVVFGTVVSGRPADLEGINRMVGLFINTVPLRIKCRDQVNFSQLANQVQRAILTAEQYHYLPLPEMLARTKLKQKTLDHIIAFENYPVIEALATSSFAIEKFETVAEPTNYNLNLIIIPQSELTIKISYNSHVYHERVIETVKKHIVETASKMTGDTWSLFTDEQFQQKLADEIWESVKYAELSDVLSGNRLFPETASLEEQGDFEFG